MWIEMIKENTNVNNSLENVIDIEPTNEGFDNEINTIPDAIALMEADFHKLEMAQMAFEVETVCKLHKGTLLTEEVEPLREASFKGAIETVKNFFIKVWARVKEAFNTLEIKILKLFKADGKLLQLASKALDGIASTDKVELEGYKYTINQVDPYTIYQKMIETIENNDDFSNNDAVIDTICKAGTGFDKENYQKEIAKKLRDGKDKKEKIVFNKTTVMDNIKNYKLNISLLKDIKKEINSSGSFIINQLKPIKTEDGEGEEDQKNTISYMKTATSIAINCVNLKMKAVKESVSQSRSFISKAVSKGRKLDRKGVNTSEVEAEVADDDNADNDTTVNESTGIDFSRYMSQF